MKKYKLALVGATGLVGRKALQVLEEFNLPISEYAFFCSSRSAGQKIKFMGKEYITRELKEDSFDEGFDFALKIEGEYDNVVGFPLELFKKMLKEF